MVARLEARLEQLETKFKPQALCAVIQAVVSTSAAGESRYGELSEALHSGFERGLDENGNALISAWWSVWFFEGTREQQDARLKELRLEPQYQKPWAEGEIPVRLEGGATCDDAYTRIHEQRQSRKP